jgi:sugar phosphate isomerase/epimerase
MFRVGLNPYGLAYSIGLQGRGTARANPAPISLAEFIALASRLGAACVELDGRWLADRSDDELARVGYEISSSGMTPICSDWLLHQPGETLDHALRYTALLGASLLRLHLTPVLEGARARRGAQWPVLLEHARHVLADAARKATARGVALAIENHQDLTSEELLAIASEAGDNVGVVMDTGNPFAVAEDPVAFARRAAARIRHVHLKDYRAQFTGQGYRLVRCAIGDGCVPFAEIAAALPKGLTASIEPGALEARHIRLLETSWWEGYAPREARELATVFGRLQHRRLSDHEDIRTPWEAGADAATLMRYELEQVERSMLQVHAMALALPLGTPLS